MCNHNENILDGKLEQEKCSCHDELKNKSIKKIRRGCGCCNSENENSDVEDEDEEDVDLKSKSFISGIIFLIIGIGITLYGSQDLQIIRIAAYFISYLCIGKDVLLTAGRNILKGEIFDENFLMSIASLGAFAIGEYPEAVAVMLFYTVGEYMQMRAVAHSKKSIKNLMDIRPDIANKKTENGIEIVPAENVKIDDIILVKVGEKVPLDGVVVEGASTMDTKALTGESLPKDVFEGTNVLSGSINGEGLLLIRVTKEFAESTASKIIELVQNASSKKAKTEDFITKFARYYTPAVVGASAALAVIPPFLLGMGSFSEWLYRALVFLVISCPCALVISIPLGFFGGIGAASSKGILVKGSNFLEALNSVDTVIFDKTGTLTDGVFKVTDVINNGQFTKEQVLEYGAYAENHSTHPIAVSIKKKYLEGANNKIDESKIAEIVERAGFGIKVKIDGSLVLAGNARLMEEEKISMNIGEQAGTVVYIAVDGNFAGTVVISDEAKKDSKLAIDGLRETGVKLIAMLTGDSQKIGKKIADELNIDQFYAELLPHEKVEVLEKIFETKVKDSSNKRKGNVVFVGDGINDAPVLARADIGIAMGGVGSDAAIEAADIVIMTDEPSKIITAIKIAKKTRKIVSQNILFALTVKGIVLILGALGLATMWAAVFADVGVALLAVLNSMRAGRIE